jgi:[glutamine synthetase] adenylyltransferase / [glutamine synthetase]-adenylyl-L-tyrosine phosphorylase
MIETQVHSLVSRLTAAPLVHDDGRATREMAVLIDQVNAQPELSALSSLTQQPSVKALLSGVFSASPYLSRLIGRYPRELLRCLTSAPEALSKAYADELSTVLRAAPPRTAAMQALRLYKSQIALLTALADLGGVWPVLSVTRALAEAADTAVSAALEFLFAEAQRRGEWLDSAPQPETRSGYFIIAMGKHGAFELNYSSDIDLIVFYDAALPKLDPSREVQTYFVRLTRDLVKLLQEPTSDGYVFRTDLRLRPDPGSTAIALSTTGALNYYESVGQNWERAALIKARIIAGDQNAGQRFLSDIAPFVWRKYLDFAAIADVHAMKRQIHAVRGFNDIAVAGHNIKVGRGGIREIEFFAQTQQLIAGGRQTDLRIPDTLGALDALCARNWIKANVRDDLNEAYCFLRLIEHRLQMIADEQTQTLPKDTDALASLAAFSGFASFDDFANALTKRLATVQQHYRKLFEASPTLTATGRDMVFAGATDDPATLATLSNMGFSQPATVIECVRGWHHGRVRAIRSARARELLTEMQPHLIEALSATANPDQAFSGFDRFLADLPSSVQLFSLLKQHPALLDLVATIMGTAPRLSRVLSHRGRVLDAVMDPGFFGQRSDAASYQLMSDSEFVAASFEQALDRARILGSEQAFLIGVRVLTGTINASDAGSAYAQLADQLIEALAGRVASEMVSLHGSVSGRGAAVVALGKLGGREMTAASDLDLIVIYDSDTDAPPSNGPKQLAPAQYFARLTQRLIGAFTVPTAEGALYEIDMRLRPSGQKGPVATQLSSFIDYQHQEAWTWEHMALTRARVVSGSPALRSAIDAAIRNVLCRPRDRAKISTDVRDMRHRIVEAKGTLDPWDLKQVRGGLVDIEFIVQYLQLVHAATDPGVLDQNTIIALEKLRDRALIAPATAATLLAAAQRLNNLTQVLRLSLVDAFDPATAPDGLKRLLAQVGDAPTFGVLAADLAAQHQAVAELFDQLVV